MSNATLVLAEMNPTLRRVMQAGLERSDFLVVPVQSLEEALEASVKPGVEALLLSGDLAGEVGTRLGTHIMLILLASRYHASLPYLWIRKPFDPALLAQFLSSRYHNVNVLTNRRRSCRLAAKCPALVLAESAGNCTYTETIDLSEHGCSVFHGHGTAVGTTVQVLLHLTKRERCYTAVVRNARLTVAQDGELRRAIGLEFMEASP